MQGRNLELKARLRSAERAGAVCRSILAEDRGLLLQTDTYFRAPNGRLKLREEEGRAELIAYARPDESRERESSFRRTSVADPAALGAALAEALGVLTTVRKRRRLYIWHGVRIHLDEVEGLGDFVEFEAPLRENEAATEAGRRIAELRERMDVQDGDLISTSYSDLLLAARAEAS